MTVRRLVVRFGPSLLAATLTVASLLDARPSSAQTEPIVLPPQVASPPKAPPDDGDEPKGLLREPMPLTMLARLGDRASTPAPPRDGFYPRIGTTMIGSGWIAVGPGFRHHLGDSPLVFDASGSVSWHQYSTAEGKTYWELPGQARITADVLWQDRTQSIFFGLGPRSSLSKRTEYRAQATDFTLSVASRQDARVSVGARAGRLEQSALSEPAGWHNPGFPDIRLRFTEAQAPGVAFRPSLWHGDADVTLRYIDSTNHPTSGGLVQLYASAYRDSQLNRYSYNQYALTVIQLVPVVPRLWHVALRGTAVASETPADSNVPFDHLPSLGGENGLRAYEDERFRDRDLLSATIESRWALLPHLDAVIFGEAGSVAPRFNAFTRHDVKTSYGAGLRLHGRTRTLARFDWAWGAEGWRFQARLTDPLFFTIFKRWATAIPIVP